MTPKDRDALRRSLQDRARQIINRSELRLESADDPPEPKEGVPDIGDMSIADFNKALQADLDERDRGLLVLIRAAFDRMSAGTYGTCLVCGLEIELDRLRALPWAPLCAADQEQVEAERGVDPSPTL